MEDLILRLGLLAALASDRGGVSELLSRREVVTLDLSLNGGDERLGGKGNFAGCNRKVAKSGFLLLGDDRDNNSRLLGNVGALLPIMCQLGAGGQ
jgi:hypothetical protein